MPTQNIGSGRLHSDPAFQPGKPEHFRRVAQKMKSVGRHKEAALFERAAIDGEMMKERRALGTCSPAAVIAAQFLAAILASGRRMPAGAKRWMAQQALEQWLPHLPAAERPAIVATLKRAEPRALGKQLTEIIQAMGEGRPVS